VAGGQDQSISRASGAQDECISRIPQISDSHATYLILCGVVKQKDEKKTGKIREEEEGADEEILRNE
jgi:hypothetical protein